VLEAFHGRVHGIRLSYKCNRLMNRCNRVGYIMVTPDVVTHDNNEAGLRKVKLAVNPQK